MADLEKIQQLIDPQTKENNYIAICFMMEVLGLTFEEAFAKLQLCKEAPNEFYIEIAEIKILYKAHYVRTIDVPSAWTTIDRNISVAGKTINTNEFTYVEDDIPEDMLLDNIALIQEDREKIVPIIKTLFQQIHSPNK